MSDERQGPDSKAAEIDPSIIELPFDLADMASGIADGEASPIILVVGLAPIVPILAFWLCRILWRSGRRLARSLA